MKLFTDEQIDEFVDLCPLKAFGQNIVVKKLEEEEMTRGGIVIPESARDKRQDLGVVLHTGPGGLNEDGIFEPVPLQTGDLIVFPGFAGQDISIDGAEWYIVNYRDTLALYEASE